MRYAAFLLLIALTACTGATDPAPAPAPVPAKDTRSWAVRFAERIGREPLDYANEDFWGCAGDAPCRRSWDFAKLLTDGTYTIMTLASEPEPAADCFYIYPTVDGTFENANHDDTKDFFAPASVIELQAAPFSQTCQVYAPFYRQAQLGSYLAPAKESAPIFRNAFADIATAFEYYLAHYNKGRPMVIMGHSQGAQMASYLLHVYFDGVSDVTRVEGSRTTTELRKRLALAMPIGFSVFAPFEKLVGGSFSDLPLCSADDETGCVIAYRSFPEKYAMNLATAGADIDEMLAQEGLLNRGFDTSKDEQSCVNPAIGPYLDPQETADVDGEDLRRGEIRLVLGTYWDSGLGGGGIDTDPSLQQLPGLYTATCRRSLSGGNVLAFGFHRPVTGTEMREDPLGVGGAAGRSAIGLHLFDYHLVLGDLIEQVRRRTPQ